MATITPRSTIKKDQAILTVTRHHDISWHKMHSHRSLWQTRKNFKQKSNPTCNKLQDVLHLLC